MTNLQRLFTEQGQSPWIDNLERGYVRTGKLRQLADQGIRGVTSNPTIMQRAISGAAAYDEQIHALSQRGLDVESLYWELVTSDIEAALDVLRPLHDASGGTDGFVSVELPPAMAGDTQASIARARELHQQIDEPNLFVKIPATDAGIPAIRQMIAEGHSINITLVFSLPRYEQVIEAYLSGLEAHEGDDLAGINSVASFFVSRVDTEVDKRLDTIGTAEAAALRGKVAVAQAKLAYDIFRQRFQGPRWDALAARGARLQRPLWASTSTKNPDYPDTLYVDSLIGPDTVNTMPESTIAAVEDHATVARTVDRDVGEARRVFERLASLGIDMDDVGRLLEEQGAASFAKSYDDLLDTLREQVAGAKSSASRP